MEISWKIREIKRAAARSLRHNFVACLSVCFVMVFIAGAYGGSTQFIASYDMQNVTNLRVDAATKREVVRSMIDEGLTASEADDRYNIGDVKAVENWKNSYLEYGENSLNAKELTFFHSGNESSNWAIIDDTVSLISGKQRPMTAFVSEKTRRNEQKISDVFDMITKEYSPHFQILAGILSFFSDMSGWDILVTCATSLFAVLTAIFVTDVLTIGERRFFLENRSYRRTTIGRMGFMLKERCFRPLITIVKMHVYRGLWFLTVVGGFYKTYEYYMIPFILAENPNISSKDAFALSKKMMKGSKWKTFLLNASFLCWELPIVAGSVILGLIFFGDDYIFLGGVLSYAALGIARIGFLNAYKTASDAELYMQLRRAVIEEGGEYAALFTDEFLDPGILEKDREYDTAVGRLEGAEIRLLDKYPGADQHGTKQYVGISRKQVLVRHDYHRSYPATSVILMFFLYSIVGWFWEVVIHVIEDGELINRGSLHGPWLPIYGFGGAIAVLALAKFRDRPAASFILMITGSAAFEYVTSWYFEYSKGLQYWNYNGYFLNLNGRICLEGIIVFGFAGMLCIYILGPMVDDVASKFPKKVTVTVCVVLIVIIVADAVYSYFEPNSGKGITDYARSVVEYSQILT
ncbi:MAG: DUF975 family protein [Ruminococcus sp.]|nr:DUF975 family protein [Ruminococcus sp.]